MSQYAYKIANYRYDEPGDLASKVFKSEDGGTRSFKIVVSSAYDAGIVGSEFNGVAVLDDDNRAIVFDQGGKSYNKASQQLLAAELVNAPDWPSFTALLKQQPRLRQGVVPDIDKASPDYTYPMPAAENWDVMKGVKQEGPEEDPYTYPAQTRSEVIAELIKHSMHRDGYGPFRLAWNIKLRDFDSSGKGVTDYPADPQFDQRWEEELQGNSGQRIYERAQEGALSQFVGGTLPGLRSEYTTYPGDDQGDYGFSIEGRSGGWLVLSEVAGLGRLGWGSQAEMEEALKELDADELRKLYRVVRNLDRDVTPAKAAQEMAYQYAYIRNEQEEEWKAELEDAPAARP